MKILFITGGLDFGRGGVADYCGRLGRTLETKGAEVRFLSWSERNLPAPEIDETSLRLPAKLSLSQKQLLARRFVEGFSPDKISLQFVPFAFEPRGLPWGLADELNPVIGGAPLHIFAHELWVMACMGSGLKNKLIGETLQKHIVLETFRKLKPVQIDVSVDLYRDVSLKEGFKNVGLLELFGTVEVIEPTPGPSQQPGGENNTGLRPATLSAEGADLRRVVDGSTSAQVFNPGSTKGAENQKSHGCLFPPLSTFNSPLSCSPLRRLGFFGNIFPSTPLEKFFAQAVELQNQTGLTLAICSAGNLPPAALRRWEGLQRKFGARLPIERLGSMTPVEISHYLRTLDFAISGYSPTFWQKSSAIAAARERGKPVILLSPAETKASHALPDGIFTRLTPELLQNPPKIAPRNMLDIVAQSYLNL